MSREDNKTFWEEIQEKYKIERIEYTPAYYLESGMKVTFIVENKELRPDCPECGKRPNIHEYLPDFRSVSCSLQDITDTYQWMRFSFQAMRRVKQRSYCYRPVPSG